MISFRLKVIKGENFHSLNVAKCNLGEVKLKTVLASSFSNHSSHLLWGSPVSSRASRLYRSHVTDLYVQCDGASGVCRSLGCHGY